MRLPNAARAVASGLLLLLAMVSASIGRAADPEISLPDAVREALASNLDLLAQGASAGGEVAMGLHEGQLAAIPFFIRHRLAQGFQLCAQGAVQRPEIIPANEIGIRVDHNPL